jgi:uncharacterized membrane protein YkoI
MKLNKKLLLAAVVFLLLVSAGYAGVEISRANSLKQAKTTVQQYVSASAELLSVRSGGDRYVFKYFDVGQQERSIIEVDKKDGQIRKIQTQRDTYNASNTALKNDEELKAIVIHEVADAVITGIIPSAQPENRTCAISFTATGLCGTYLLDPANGSILARTIKFGSPVVIPFSGESDKICLLALSEFKRIGNQKVPGAVFQDLDIAYAGGVFTAEIDLYSNGIEHELVLDATNGTELAYRSFKDDWQSYGSWEPRDLEKPLLNIINYDLAQASLKPTADPLPSIFPAESTAASETQPTAVATSASANPSEPVMTQPAPTNTSATTHEPAATTAKITPTTTPVTTAAPIPKMISISRAKSLVLVRLPGAAFDGIDLDQDDGRILYKGKAIKGVTEVDFEIDAYTGTFTKWDVDTNDDQG